MSKRDSKVKKKTLIAHTKGTKRYFGFEFEIQSTRDLDTKFFYWFPDKPCLDSAFH